MYVYINIGNLKWKFIWFWFKIQIILIKHTSECWFSENITVKINRRFKRPRADILAIQLFWQKTNSVSCFQIPVVLRWVSPRCAGHPDGHRWRLPRRSKHHWHDDGHRHHRHYLSLMYTGRGEPIITASLGIIVIMKTFIKPCIRVMKPAQKALCKGKCYSVYCMN